MVNLRDKLLFGVKRKMQFGSLYLMERLLLDKLKLNSIYWVADGNCMLADATMLIAGSGYKGSFSSFVKNLGSAINYIKF